MNFEDEENEATVPIGERTIKIEEAPRIEDIPKVELDMSVPHGQLAAKSHGRGEIRVAGQVQVGGRINPTPATKEEEEKPEEGSFAPAFRAISYDGKMVDLVALEGRKVWLIFYRYATCPLCNLHLAQIQERYPAIKKAGVEVIAIFESAVPEFYYPGGSTHPAFSVISDPEKKLYKLYQTTSSVAGVLHPRVAFGLAKALMKGFKQGKIEGEFGQMPSHFLIDARGIIQTAHRGQNAVDHLPWHKIGMFAKISPADLNPPKNQRK